MAKFTSRPAAYKKIEFAGGEAPRLVYAIGDVHGETAHLQAVLDQIEAWRAGAFADAEPLVVFLGDYIDRGPDSKGAVDLVMRTLERYPGSVAIRGNHDARFGEWAARHPKRMMMSGDTLKSFGITDVQAANRKNKKNPQADIDNIDANNIAPEYRAFLNDTLVDVLEISCAGGRFAFVHGGVDWSKSLDMQDARFCWFGNGSEFWDYRGTTHEHPANFQIKNLFFGHWIWDKPKVWPDGRVGLDTISQIADTALSFARFSTASGDVTYWRTDFSGNNNNNVVPASTRAGESGFYTANAGYLPYGRRPPATNNPAFVAPGIMPDSMPPQAS